VKSVSFQKHNTHIAIYTPCNLRKYTSIVHSYTPNGGQRFTAEITKQGTTNNLVAELFETDQISALLSRFSALLLQKTEREIADFGVHYVA